MPVIQLFNSSMSSEERMELCATKWALSTATKSASHAADVQELQQQVRRLTDEKRQLEEAAGHAVGQRETPSSEHTAGPTPRTRSQLTGLQAKNSELEAQVARMQQELHDAKQESSVCAVL